METPIGSILARKGSDIFSVGAQATVGDAVRLMNERNIGAVAVMDGGQLLGIFTERDVLRRVIDGGMDPESTPVREVMTTQLAYVRPETTIGEAMAIVHAEGCRHLPVVRGEELAGIISTRDLISSALDGQEHEISELVQYISGGYGAALSPMGRGDSI